ncbi:MAG: YfhO family protein, partial [Candidatus Omnitrophica bacterium]|nr:YfhO family protein [Candidatus Omnitrophota bacterium]
MKLAVAILLFIAVTVVFFYPVFSDFSSSIAAFSSTDEPYGVIWSFWWSKFAFLNKINQDFINVIAYPFGIVQNAVIFFPLWGLIAKYLAIIFNEVFAYNAILMSSYVLAALSMFALVFYLSRSWAVSVFSGLIYSFCPFHLVRTWQHFGTAQIQWMPLYLLLLFKLRDRQNLKLAFLLGIVFALNYYFDVHYAYFMAIMTLFFLIFMLPNAKSRVNFVKFLLIGLGVGALLVIPAFLPFLKRILNGAEVVSARSLVRPFEDLFSQSARPLSYLLPFTEQPIFGNFTKMFVGSKIWGESLTEHNVFLGFIPVALACFSFVKRRTLVVLMKARGIDAGFALKFFFWFVLASWLFSQPPWWNFFGLKIYMPSFFLYKALPMFRAYVRFSILVTLGISVLAGFGLLLITDRLRARRVFSLAAVIFLAIFTLFEFWPVPSEHTINLSSYNKVYDWLRSQEGDFAIAEYPLDIDGPNETYKFYQTKHQKKIINGTLPGTYAHTVSKSLVRLSNRETLQNLRWMGVKFILVHP